MKGYPKVYPAGEHWVVADPYWLPGVYATREAAELAPECDDAQLLELHESLDRPITTSDLHALQPVSADDHKSLHRELEVCSRSLKALTDQQKRLILEADVKASYMYRHQLAKAADMPPSRLYRILRAAGHPIREK